MYTAEAKNLKISPRKVRLVVEGIKKMPIQSAVATLELSPKGASTPIKKALLSAVANAVHNGQVDKANLFISEMFVNEGIVYKRFHYAGRGRIRPYQKKTSHLKVILGVKESVAKKDAVAVLPAKTNEAQEKAAKVKAVKKGKEELKATK